MTINIINLDIWQQAISIVPSFKTKDIQRNREERLLSVCKQSKEQGFSVRFWEGVIEKKGCTGISKAFKNIVRWAKLSGLNSVTIGEDDILFSAPGAWDYYKINMPSEYDIYSGGVYYGEIKNGRIVNGYSGNTLITVHEKFYDFFLSANENDHLDRWLGNYAFEKKYMVCEPFVVKQMQGFSDNHRRPTKHAGYLEDMKLFGVS